MSPASVCGCFMHNTIRADSRSGPAAKARGEVQDDSFSCSVTPSKPCVGSLINEP